MTRRWLPFLLCLSVCLAAVHHSAARALLRVDEAAIKFLLEEGRTEVSLGVENRTGRAEAARVELELLTPRGQIQARAVQTETLREGASTLRVPIQFSYEALSNSLRHEFPLYRLRYRIVVADAAHRGAGVVEGIVSLSEISPDIFELQVISPQRARAGTRFRVRVQTAQLRQSQPVRGVSVSGELRFPAGKLVVLKASGTTDAEGEAVLDFELPRELADEGKLRVAARRGGFAQESVSDVELDAALRLLVTTDKSLYQPGQTLHVRALAFDATRRAAADRNLTLKIHDPEHTVVFSAPLKTSRFGVASADWPISENTRLGLYQVAVETEDESYGEDSVVGQSIKISRYDLPNFTVAAKPDRPFYLAEQSAEVAVSGGYLFGQPVKHGHVRVVRQDERQWNHREQKYEVTEGETVEGELDETGRFVAHLDLRDQHRALAERDVRFRDLEYAAYVTDPTTNRTEQRRFNLRITRDPIHIYVTSGRYRQAEGLPLAFYVSTFYADGTPAPCEVSVTPEAEAKQSASIAPGMVKTVALKAKPPRVSPFRVRTNRYGVARVSGAVVRGADESGEDSRMLSLEFLARDAGGRVGHQEKHFWLHEGAEVRVETDKTLYRAGDPIALELTATEPEATVFVDVLREGRTLASQPVRLHGGRAALMLPYTSEFRGRLLVNAYTSYTPGKGFQDEDTRSERTILYPRNDELKLELRLDRTDYRPGDEASAELSVRAQDGRTMESALGVVVFDKAVEERASTDSDFSSSFGFGAAFYDFRYGSGEVAGVNRRDIERLDLSKPVPAEMETVAELLFNSWRGYFPLDVAYGLTFETKPAQLYHDLTTAQLKPLREALAARYTREIEYPREEAELIRLSASGGADFSALRDPWGVPYRAAFSVKRTMDALDVISNGADKRPDTADDFSALHLEWPYFRPTAEKISRIVERYHRRTGDHIRDAATLREELRREGLDPDALLRDRWNHPLQILFDTATAYERQIESSSPYVEGAFRPRIEVKPFWQILHFIKLRSPGADGLPGTNDDFSLAEISGVVLERRASTSQASRTSSMLTTFGGDTGAIRGTVKDTNGASIAETAVVARHQGTGREFNTQTDEDGNYRLLNLPAGLYTLRFDARDFITMQVDGVVVLKGNLTNIDAQLQVGGTTETVTVTTSDVEVLNVTNATTGRTVVELPFARAPGVAAAQISTPRLREFFPETLVWQPSIETDRDGRAHLRFKFADNITTWKLSVIGSNAEGQLGMAEQEIRAFQPFFVEHDPPRILTEGDEIDLPVVLRNYLSQPQSIAVELKPESWFTLKSAARTQTDVAAGEAAPAVFGFRAVSPVKDGKQRITATGTEASDAIEKPVSVHPDGEEVSQTTGQILDADATLDAPIPADALVGTLRAELKIYPSLSAHLIESVEAIMQRPYGCGEQAISSTYPSLLALRYYRGQRTGAGVGSDDGGGDGKAPGAQRSARDEARGAGELPPIAARAARNVQLGYERLLGYRTESGGFSYWGRGDADVALTAYAVRFLDDARQVVDVDRSVIEEARDWLVEQQRADGSWPPYPGTPSTRDANTAFLTAYVARVLAHISADAPAAPASRRDDATKAVETSLKRALQFLSPRIERTDQPYLVASYALAALDAGQASEAARATAKLRALAQDEGALTYWSLDTNTPFYGWGLGGRIETTALAVQALTRAADARDDALVKRGLLYLMRHKDRYGVWLSTQATINVLDALLSTTAHTTHTTRTSLDAATSDATSTATSAATPAMTSTATSAAGSATTGASAGGVAGANGGDTNGGGGTAEIFVNGQRALTVALPPAGTPSAPISVDLSRFLAPTGSNRVEIRRTGLAQNIPAQAQLVTAYYVPWTRLSPASAVNASPRPAPDGNASPAASSGAASATSHIESSGAASANSFVASSAASSTSSRAPSGTVMGTRAAPLVSLSVKFDRTEAAINQEINCHVEAARIDSRGYGMLLGEIGLPPGAEVDRASLDAAIQKSGWQFSRYDLLPDRLVVYLWPNDGERVGFDFKFRPRFGLDARSAPSQLYDYYNPEARALLAPTKFVIR